MRYTCTVIAVADIKAARKFYEDLFGLEVFQDYGRNIAFTCGLALQQDFDWLVNLPKEKVLKNPTMRKSSLRRTRTLTDFCTGWKNTQLGPAGDPFYDPDGHIIEVGEDMKMVIKRFLASGMTMEEISVKWTLPWRT